MRTLVVKSLCILAMLFLIPGAALTLDLGWKGLVTGWATFNFDELAKPQIGLRCIPEFSLKKALSQKYTLDAELALNIYGSGHFEGENGFQTDGEFESYRVWVRFSASQYEVRVGLQKINFGSAMLLRPLMWFDSIDPRDPLQLTDGVYGLLFRYYFVDNTNVWLWTLYGNNNRKGWEFTPTEKDSVEYGGRIQVPLLQGELALSFHHRRMDIGRLFNANLSPDDRISPENRWGLDGKWDIGIGIWFEGVLIHQDSSLLPWKWRRALNIGADYTFGIGNGLNVFGEYFLLGNSQKAFGSGENIEFSAFMLRYPLSILDSISGIFYYDWENKEFYRLINWQRTYDKWSINVLGFWNPKDFQIYQQQGTNGLFAGTGFQVMVIYNY